MIEIIYFLVFAWFFIHLIECIYYRKIIDKSPHGKLKGYLYTFLFAAVMVLVVASVLAFTSQSLKDLQNENVRKD